MPTVQWHELFKFTVSPVELFIRGTVIYIFILALMRTLRREPGTISIADLLMVVLIADASQNAMAAEYRSVLDGLVLVGTIVFWNFAMDWLTLRIPAFERFTHPPPVSLIHNGRINEVNMRRQFLTRAQLQGMLREHGFDDVQKVKDAFLEGSGHFSVIELSETEHRAQVDDRRDKKII